MWLCWFDLDFPLELGTLIYTVLRQCFVQDISDKILIDQDLTSDQRQLFQSSSTSVLCFCYFSTVSTLCLVDLEKYYLMMTRLLSSTITVTLLLARWTLMESATRLVRGKSKVCVNVIWQLWNNFIIRGPCEENQVLSLGPSRAPECTLTTAPIKTPAVALTSKRVSVETNITSGDPGNDHT